MPDAPPLAADRMPPAADGAPAPVPAPVPAEDASVAAEAEPASAQGLEIRVVVDPLGSAGDFAAFVRGRTPALLRTAFLLTGDQQLAEDLVQSALIRTHRAWHKLSGPDHADAYTRKAIYHLQVSRWRRRKLAESPVAQPPEPDRTGGDEASGVVTRLTLLAALRTLTAGQRAVLVLRYFEDRTEAETAALLGVSVGTVKSQTSRALARLRRIAPDLYPTWEAQ